MKVFYKGIYGGSASIHTKASAPNYAELIVRDAYGKLIVKRKYASERGAKIAMSKYLDSYTKA